MKKQSGKSLHKLLTKWCKANNFDGLVCFYTKDIDSKIWTGTCNVGDKSLAVTGFFVGASRFIKVTRDLCLEDIRKSDHTDQELIALDRSLHVLNKLQSYFDELLGEVLDGKDFYK